MRSSAGQHWVALDHVRALAAFCVFTWHFIHTGNGYPVPFEGAPAVFPLAILDEGHTGVALFMTLSGYLFAKLLDGKEVNYRNFFWNRAVRLLPLLAVVVVLAVLDKHLAGTLDWRREIQDVAWGWLLPVVTNGRWSITVEAHFYLILPLLMSVTRKQALAPLAVVAAAIAIRLGVWLHSGEIQHLAFTIVGHLDQFLLGIFAFQNRDLMRRRHVMAGVIAVCFAGFYYVFDRLGGWYPTAGQPSFTWLWIVIPTVEAVAFGALIAWYDTSFSFTAKGISGLVGKIGACSYSIYLLHFFVVADLAKLIHAHVMDLSNFYVACAWSALCFVAIVPFCWLSFAFFEKPIMDRFRVRYVKPSLDGSERTAPGTLQAPAVSPIT